MKKKDATKKIEERQPGEPAWLYDDPDQGPVEYSEKDYAEFADGFIRSNRDVLVVKNMIKKLGLKGAKDEIAKALKSKHKIADIMSKFN